MADRGGITINMIDFAQEIFRASLEKKELVNLDDVALHVLAESSVRAAEALLDQVLMTAESGSVLDGSQQVAS